MNDKIVKVLRALVSEFSTESYRNDKNNNFYAQIHTLKGFIKNQTFLMENGASSNQKDIDRYNYLLKDQRDEVSAEQFLASTLKKKKCLHFQKCLVEARIASAIWLLKEDFNHEFGKFENTSGIKPLKGDELTKTANEAKMLQKQLAVK